MGNFFRRVERNREKFILAPFKGDLNWGLKRVRKLIGYATEEDKEHVLSIAASVGHLDMVRFLVEHCLATWRESALREASRREDVDVEQYLAERCHATLNVSDALVRAARSGHVDVVQYLFERCGADVNAKDELGNTAFNWATFHDFVSLSQYLVEQCAVDKSVNALTEGARRGSPNVVRYFVEQCGVDVNMKDDRGQTAVTAAIATGEIDVVRYLVEECNADVSSKEIRLAADGGHIDIQRILTPFLPPEAGETTKDCGDVMLASDIHSVKLHHPPVRNRVDPFPRKW